MLVAGLRQRGRIDLGQLAVGRGQGRVPADQLLDAARRDLAAVERRPRRLGRADMASGPRTVSCRPVRSPDRRATSRTRSAWSSSGERRMGRFDGRAPLSSRGGTAYLIAVQSGYIVGDAEPWTRRPGGVDPAQATLGLPAPIAPRCCRRLWVTCSIRRRRRSTAWTTSISDCGESRRKPPSCP